MLNKLGKIILSPPAWVSVLISLLSAIVGATLWNIFEDLAVSNVLENPQTMIIAFAGAGILSMVIIASYMMKQVDELNKQHRLDIRYIPRGNSPEEESRVYTESRKFIEFAEEGADILAVNSFVEVFKEASQADNKDFERQLNKARQERENYLGAIELKTQIANYQRIVQLNYRDRTVNMAERVAENYRQHYLKIVKLRGDGNSSRKYKLNLFMTHAQYPTSFVVISNKDGTNYLIWQINEHIENEDEIDTYRLSGVFLIADPDEQIIQYFKGWFNTLMSSRDLRPIKERELISEND